MRLLNKMFVIIAAIATTGEVIVLVLMKSFMNVNIVVSDVVSIRNL